MFAAQAFTRAVVRPHRKCWSVCLSVGRSVTLHVVSPAKLAQPIEMPFGLRTWVGPRNHILDGSPDPPIRMGNFEVGGRGVPL